MPGGVPILWLEKVYTILGGKTRGVSPIVQGLCVLVTNHGQSPPSERIAPVSAERPPLLVLAAQEAKRASGSLPATAADCPSRETDNLLPPGEERDTNTADSTRHRPSTPC